MMRKEVKNNMLKGTVSRWVVELSLQVSMTGKEANYFDLFGTVPV